MAIANKTRRYVVSLAFHYNVIKRGQTCRYIGLLSIRLEGEVTWATISVAVCCHHWRWRRTGAGIRPRENGGKERRRTDTILLRQLTRWLHAGSLLGTMACINNSGAVTHFRWNPRDNGGFKNIVSLGGKHGGSASLHGGLGAKS